MGHYEGRCPLGFPHDRHPLAGATNTNEAALISAGVAESTGDGKEMIQTWLQPGMGLETGSIF